MTVGIRTLSIKQGLKPGILGLGTTHFQIGSRWLNRSGASMQDVACLWHLKEGIAGTGMQPGLCQEMAPERMCTTLEGCLYQLLCLAWLHWIFHAEGQLWIYHLFLKKWTPVSTLFKGTLLRLGVSSVAQLGLTVLHLSDHHCRRRRQAQCLILGEG